MRHRSRQQLEEAIEKTRSRRIKALAYYKLGLFHDNNSREAEAISNYVTALRLGLDIHIKAKALAWLGSSLYKIGKPKEGLKRCKESQKIAKDAGLRKFLVWLEKRIKKCL